jgi:hypothetical protein
MVLTKDSEEIKIFKELVKDSLNKNASFTINNISFIPEKGIKIVIDECDTSTIYIKNPNVDFAAAVSNLIIPIILGAISNKDSINIVYSDNGKVEIDDTYAVEIISPDNSSKFYNQVSEPMITFTKEQYAKLEKDFDLTKGNYFSNEKNVDTIGFVNDEGSIKLISTGAYLYKYSDNLDATIDTVVAEQIGGHDVQIFLLPRKIYDITKHFKDSLKISLGGQGCIEFESDTIYFNYSTVNFGTTKYKSVKNDVLTTGNTSFKISDIKDVMIDLVEPILNNNFIAEEDSNIEIVSDNGKMLVSLNDNQIIKLDNEVNLSLAANAEVLLYLCKNYPNAEVYEKIDENEINNYFIAKDGQSSFVFTNLKF